MEEIQRKCVVVNVGYDDTIYITVMPNNMEKIYNNSCKFLYLVKWVYYTLYNSWDDSMVSC